MIAYTVHEPPNPPADRIDRALALAFVREGFNRAAFLFAPFWMIARGLWLGLLAYLAALVVIALVGGVLGIPPPWQGLAWLVLNGIVGAEADTLERHVLSRRGWRMVGTATGRNADECERRFFDAWLPSQPLIDAGALTRGGETGSLAGPSPAAPDRVDVSVEPRRGLWRQLVGGGRWSN